MLDAHYQYITELLDAVKEGKSSALSELYDYYQPLIGASISRCITREPRLKSFREDMERDAFLTLHDLIKQYDPELSYFSYFLATKIDYAVLSKSRRSYLGLNTTGQGIIEVSFSDLPDEWEPQLSDDPFNRLKLVHVLQEGLLLLNERQREAVDLYFFNDCNQEEAANIMGITQPSFCKLLQRSLGRLRGVVSEDFLL